MKQVDLLALEKLLRPAVEAHGFDWVDVAWTREFGRQILRVMIDRKQGQGTISVEDCSLVSHEVSTLLDVNDACPGVYSLEVSSPGENRPLKSTSDFIRFVGKRAKIRLQVEPEQPRRSLVGLIHGVRGEDIGLELEDSKEIVWISWPQVEKANLMESFNATKRKP